MMPNPIQLAAVVQQNTQAHRPSGITRLGPLLKPADLALIKITVRDYLQEQQVATRQEAIPLLEAQSNGVGAVTFQLNTLLQLLSWKRLLDAKKSTISHRQIRQLFEDMLSSEQAREIGTRLNRELGWYGSATDKSADPEIIRQLVWLALLLEIDPSYPRKTGHMAGHDFTGPENRGKSLVDIQTEFERFLSWKTVDIEGNRSRKSARLAACILAPMAPELAVRGMPRSLRYGTAVWVNFAHGVALAEALFPGSSQGLDYEQLLNLPINMSQLATDRERGVVIETRLAPALQWAIANNALPTKDEAIYSETEIATAMAALDEQQRNMALAMDALLQKVPDRLQIGLGKLSEVMGARAGELMKMIMRPTTIGKRFEYALRNPAPSIRPGRFYLLDVFVAGLMKEGTDKFEPDPQIHEGFWLNIYAHDLERLKGIDINELYEAAFAAYAYNTEKAYACLIEMLMDELPFSDRQAILNGRVDVYLLQGETGINIDKETSRDRQLHQGRMGFILICSHAGHTFAYEVFPLLGILQRRTDLHPLPHGGLIKAVPGGVQRMAVQLPLDWEAYNKPVAPQPNVTSRVIPIHIGHSSPSNLPASSATPLSSYLLKTLAAGIARANLFFDKEVEREVHRRQTGSEYVNQNYPPALRILAIFVPGLTCFNAVQNNETPAVACAIDIGLIMAAPAFRFFKGFATLVSRAGTPAVGRRLPELAALTNSFFASSVSSYRSGLNPFEGFFFRAGRVAGTSALLIKAAYKVHEAVGQTLGRPGEFAFINGLESAATPHKWRPIAIGDRLATIFGVPDVPVRDFPTADAGVRSYLINTASGNPYGPVVEEQLRETAANEPV